MNIIFPLIALAFSDDLSCSRQTQLMAVGGMLNDPVCSNFNLTLVSDTGVSNLRDLCLDGCVSSVVYNLHLMNEAGCFTGLTTFSLAELRTEILQQKNSLFRFQTHLSPPILSPVLQSPTNPQLSQKIRNNE